MTFEYLAQELIRRGVCPRQTESGPAFLRRAEVAAGMTSRVLVERVFGTLLRQGTSEAVPSPATGPEIDTVLGSIEQGQRGRKVPSFEPRLAIQSMLRQSPKGFVEKFSEGTQPELTNGELKQQLIYGFNSLFESSNFNQFFMPTHKARSETFNELSPANTLRRALGVEDGTTFGLLKGLQGPGLLETVERIGLMLGFGLERSAGGSGERSQLVPRDQIQLSFGDTVQRVQARGGEGRDQAQRRVLDDFQMVLTLLQKERSAQRKKYGY